MYSFTVSETFIAFCFPTLNTLMSLVEEPLKSNDAASSTNPSLTIAISPSFSLVPSAFVKIVIFSYSNPV